MVRRVLILLYALGVTSGSFWVIMIRSVGLSASIKYMVGMWCGLLVFAVALRIEARHRASTRAIMLPAVCPALRPYWFIGGLGLLLGGFAATIGWALHRPDVYIIAPLVGLLVSLASVTVMFGSAPRFKANAPRQLLHPADRKALDGLALMIVACVGTGCYCVMTGADALPAQKWLRALMIAFLVGPGGLGAVWWLTSCLWPRASGPHSAR